MCLVNGLNKKNDKIRLVYFRVSLLNHFAIDSVKSPKISCTSWIISHRVVCETLYPDADPSQEKLKRSRSTYLPLLGILFQGPDKDKG